MFVFVHSPLVGPFSWALVADELRWRDHRVAVPELAHPTEAPFWSRHVASVARALADEATDVPVVLVAHSGAGALLPAIAHSLTQPVAATIFVDAGLPAGGEDRMGTGGFANLLQELYARGERFPNWRDEDLRDLVPDAAQRTRLIAELRPQPLVYWQEPLPVIDPWPDAPGAYLHFTSAYDDAAAQARTLGWPYRYLQGGHFHTLVAPAEVADALLDLTRQMGVVP